MVWRELFHLPIKPKRLAAVKRREDGELIKGKGRALDWKVQSIAGFKAGNITTKTPLLNPTFDVRFYSKPPSPPPCIPPTHPLRPPQPQHPQRYHNTESL
ncbi:hypothetical protein L1987_13989 [Smallanthus sonchifolius]|uniref:Uncharacterized protein n=1 Tax=Smallanthus sonchifolius TaxID=185202 RepID=A0ACB9JIZ3_9ASTR|nr:hypothetical protein L1987_13989 [Smallanthus sonchifolius]